MGIFNSTLFNSTQDDVDPSTIQLADPRSPTDQFTRTPIYTSALKPIVNPNIGLSYSPISPIPPLTNLYTQPNVTPNIEPSSIQHSTNLSSLSNEGIQDYGADSRSLLFKVERIPILPETNLEEKLEVEEQKPQNASQMLCESAISSYSCNVSSIDSFDSFRAPNEPSVIVSDFEDNDSVMPDYKMEFAKVGTARTKSFGNFSKKEFCVGEIFNPINNMEAKRCAINNDSAMQETNFLGFKEIPVQKSENTIIHPYDSRANTLKLRKVKKTRETKVKGKKSGIPKLHTTVTTVKVMTPGSTTPVKADKPRTPLGIITANTNSPCNNLRPKHTTNMKHLLQGIENSGLTLDKTRIFTE